MPVGKARKTFYSLDRCKTFFEGRRNIKKQNKIKVFENKQVRTLWNAGEEEWYFSVVDVCNVLADSASKEPDAYWRKLKQRLKNEGSEVVTNCHGLKMQASDGKMRETDCLNAKGVLRLVQSIPDVVCSDYLKVNGVLRCVGFTR